MTLVRPCRIKRNTLLRHHIVYYTVLSNIGHDGIANIGGGFSENRNDKFVKDVGTTAPCVGCVGFLAFRHQ